MTRYFPCTNGLSLSYCVGNLIGPQLFFEREEPRYQSGFASMLVCFGAQVFFMGLLYFVKARDNRKVSQFTLTK